MKRIILNFERKTKNFKELVQEAFNKGFLNFMVSHETANYFKDIERVNLFSAFPESFINYLVFDSKESLERLGENFSQEKNIGFYTTINSKEDEIQIIKLSKEKIIDFIIISAPNWKIIPFENLIAETQSSDIELIAKVDSIKEAELMFKTLEIGVDGILLTPKEVNDFSKLKKIIQPRMRIELTKATVKSIQNISESERVCVDTTSILHSGEGLLIGSTAKGFVLVHAEVFETKFVSSRPFRVNAGDVSAYVLVPDDGPEKVYRTNYLSELKGGMKVLVVNYKGDARIVSIGRVKIETRPMLRFELEVAKEEEKININIISQNAETIRLVDPEGNARSVVDIKVGDQVLVHIGPGATHFGTAIEEKIIEK